MAVTGAGKDRNGATIGKPLLKRWSVVVTYREQRVRIVSARRSRKEEVALYEG
jgi:uncharacterized DUF497 family protein